MNLKFTSTYGFNFWIIKKNACTLVPTVFRWHGKKEFKCHIHFSFSHGIEKQIWILLFVFRFRLTLKNGFELRISFFVFGSLRKTDINFSFRFSFSHHFEKRIWISFFGFALLWKTDLNFVSRFLSLWKTDLNFVCRFGMTWKTDHCTSSVMWSLLKQSSGVFVEWLNHCKVSFLSSFPGYNKLQHHKVLNN